MIFALIVIAFALGEIIGFILGSGMVLISDPDDTCDDPEAIYWSGYEKGVRDTECKLKGGEHDNDV